MAESAYKVSYTGPATPILMALVQSETKPGLHELVQKFLQVKTYPELGQTIDNLTREERNIFCPALMSFCENNIESEDNRVLNDAMFLAIIVDKVETKFENE